MVISKFTIQIFGMMDRVIHFGIDGDMVISKTIALI